MNNPPKSSVRSDLGVRVGDIVAGKYRVERILGQGGMGVVVSGIHAHLDERVAVKLLRPEGAAKPELAERFMREAKTVVKIKSPHVVRVSDVGIEESGRPYIIMEYLEGRDLGAELSSSGPLSEEIAVGYVLEACDAVAEAHALGIVHRDLKPSNLFLTEVAGETVVKVLDFGISKIQDTSSFANISPSITAESALLGSPFYMSPEQIRSSKDVDARTDIWSLGVILYELVTGQMPFSGATASAVLAAICADPPLPLRVARPDASSALAAIVAQCLEKDVSARIQSVRDLVVALAAIAPAKANGVLERIDRIGAATGTTGLSRSKDGTTRGSFPIIPHVNETSETVASFTQTGAPERRRSMLLFAVAAGLIAAGATFLALFTLRTSPATSNSAARPDNAPLSAATSVSPASPVAPTVSVLPSATIAATTPGPMPSQSWKGALSASSASAKPRATSSAPAIVLGKEVETRR